MAFYPNYPDNEYNFYDRNNPKLFETLRSLDKNREDVRKIIGEAYEIREGGIANLGNFQDNAIKNQEDENKANKEAMIKEKSISNLGKIKQNKTTLKSIEYLYQKYNINPNQVRPNSITMIPRTTINKGTFSIGTGDYDIVVYEDGKLTMSDNHTELSDNNGDLIDPNDFDEDPEYKKYNATNGLILLLISNNVDVIREGMKDRYITKDDISVYKGILDRFNLVNPAAANGQKYKFIMAMIEKNEIKGRGLRSEHAIKYYGNINELVDRLELLIAELQAGNNSIDLKNEMSEILDKLLVSKKITRAQYNKFYSLIA